MSKSVIIIITVIGLLTLQSVKSQDNLPTLEKNLHQQVIPPSPTISEMVRFLQVPVEHYSGIPKIDIPLLNIESRELSMPFSISYNGGGIKVEQKSGCLGLGWALHGEPIISRTVHGLPDDLSCYFDCYSGFFYNRSLFISNKDPYDKPWLEVEGYLEYETYLGELESLNTTVKRLLGASKGLIDTEPDVFSFSIEGYSGNFYLLYDDVENCFSEDYCINGDIDPEKLKVILNPLQNIDIKPSFDNEYEKLTEFVVTLPNGHKYYFDIPDEVQIHIVDLANYYYNTAWHASKIINASGTDSILIDYTIGYELDHTKSFYRMGVGGYTQSPCISCGDCAPTIEAVEHPYMVHDFGITYNMRTYHTRLISSITTLKDTVDFTHSGERHTKITMNGKDRISFYNDSQYDELTLNNINWGTSYPRHRLDSISIDDKIYSFKYYIRDEGYDYDIPNCLAPCYDHWGYFNNKNGNDYSDIESYIPSDVKDQNGNPLDYGDADHSATSSTQVASTGSLKKIIYPTGGYVEFEYEPNQFEDEGTHYFGGIRIKKIKQIDPVNGTNLIKEYKYYDPLIIADEPEYVIEKQSSAQWYWEYFKFPCAQCSNSTYHFVTVFDKPVNRIFCENGLYAAYNRVDEIERTSVNDNSSNGINGRTTFIYRFDTDNIFILDPPDYPFVKPYNIDNWKYGTLKQKVIRDNNNEVVYDEQNEYFDLNADTNFNYNLPTVKGCKFYTAEAGEMLFSCYCQDCCDKATYEEGAYLWYYNQPYEIKPGFTYLTNKSITIDNVTKEFSYLYKGFDNDTFVHNYPYSVTINSDPAKEIIYKYPLDYSPGTLAFINSLVEKNMVDQPVETQKWSNNKLIEGTIVKHSDNLFDYKELYILDIEDPLSVSKPEPPYSSLFGGVSGYDFRTRYNYDSKGTLVLIDDTFDVDQTYLWGYNYTLPIAKIENANSNEILIENFEKGNYEGWENFGSGGVIYSLENGDAGATGLNAVKFNYGEYRGICYYLPLSNIDLSGEYTLSAKVKNISAVNPKPFIGCDVIYNGQSWWPAARPDTSSTWQYVEKSIDLSSVSGITAIIIYILNGVSGYSPGNYGEILVDDIRFYPSDAQMTTYTYDPQLGITSETDPDGKTAYYEYYDFGRLQRIKDRNGNILKEFKYHYVNQ